MEVNIDGSTDDLVTWNSVPRKIAKPQLLRGEHGWLHVWVVVFFEMLDQ